MRDRYNVAGRDIRVARGSEVAAVEVRGKTRHGNLSRKGKRQMTLLCGLALNHRAVIRIETDELYVVITPETWRTAPVPDTPEAEIQRTLWTLKDAGAEVTVLSPVPEPTPTIHDQLTEQIANGMAPDGFGIVYHYDTSDGGCTRLRQVQLDFEKASRVATHVEHCRNCQTAARNTDDELPWDAEFVTATVVPLAIVPF